MRVRMPKEGPNEKYIEHALQHRFAKRPDVANRVYDLPTCKKCERVAFRHRGGVKCPICGYEGPGGAPVKVHAKRV